MCPALRTALRLASSPGPFPSRRRKSRLRARKWLSQITSRHAGHAGGGWLPGESRLYHLSSVSISRCWSNTLLQSQGQLSSGVGKVHGVRVTPHAWLFRGNPLPVGPAGGAATHTGLSSYIRRSLDSFPALAFRCLPVPSFSPPGVAQWGGNPLPPSTRT